MEANEQKLFCRLHALLLREFESTITADHHAELQSLLLERADARQLYVQYLQDTACLRWLCAEELASRCESTPAPINSAERARNRGKRWLRRSAAFVAALSCSLLVAWWLSLPVIESNEASLAESNAIAASPGNNGGSSLNSQESTSVATVTRLDSARWREAAEGGKLLARCRIGQRWQLAEGRAELTFDAGALVTVFAPADFEIISSSSIRCRRGRVTALVDDRGKGFTIETPQAMVVDLGTQFGLDVSDSGETQVIVFQGSVDLTYGSASALSEGGRSRRLEQGEALLLKKSGELQRLMAVRRDRFLSPSGYVANRPPVIADVRDNIRKNQSVKSYQIVHGGLDEDVLCFVDRDHQWNGIDKTGLPAFLRGADYIMPFNDDKFLRNLQLEVYFTRPATLYVFLDNNMEVPAWLRLGFTDTGIDIGLDGATTEWHPENTLANGAGQSIDFKFSVWRRDVKQPGPIVLGGVKPPPIRSRGFNMYGIAAVANE